MSLCVSCSEAQPRAVLSDVTTTVVAVMTAMTFAASGAAPTALYHQYQESFGLTPFAITIVFAAYVLSLLAALLTVGSLSDYVGRRPAILAALLLNVVSMAMFMTAGSEAALIAARALQGFATGLATASLGAAILDNDRSRGPILNSITAFFGLTVGSLGGAILVTYAPDPRQLVYVVLLALSAFEAIVLRFMPETAHVRAGAIASLRPHVNVPAQASPALVRLTPLLFLADAGAGA
jgi:MFS family permease